MLDSVGSVAEDMGGVNVCWTVDPVFWGRRCGSPRVGLEHEQVHQLVTKRSLHPCLHSQSNGPDTGVCSVSDGPPLSLEAPRSRTQVRRR